jgi:predicted porin
MKKITNQLAPAVLACAAAFCALPSTAAEGPITLYANLYVDFESVSASGSAAGGSNDLSRRNRVSSNSSYVGFRGVEPLGGGLEAWFQIENSVRPDSSQSGDVFASRNSGVGFKGNWGTFFLGQ